MNSRVKLMVLSACAAALVPAVGTADPAKPSVALSDMKLARDKETGQMRAPTTEEEAALAAKARMLAPSVLLLRRPVTTVEYRADGSAVAKLSLDDMDNLVMTRGVDGKTVLRHAGPSTTAAAPTK